MCRSCDYSEIRMSAMLPGIIYVKYSGYFIILYPLCIIPILYLPHIIYPRYRVQTFKYYNIPGILWPMIYGTFGLKGVKEVKGVPY